MGLSVEQFQLKCAIPWISYASYPNPIQEDHAMDHVQAELDQGASIAALRRFNDNLRALPAESWGQCSCGKRVCTAFMCIHAHKHMRSAVCGS